MNTATKVTDLNTSELLQNIRQKTLSATEATKAYLDRIDSLNTQLNAYLYLNHELALENAASIDKRLAAGDDPGPLAGLPIAAKDIFVTKDLPTSCASKILADYQACYDATAIDRLRRAGAVILGKTNMDEFAMGSSNENSGYGAGRNPWDLERVPGGSSGGSAAAVAARLCSVALGTDTGGSIRQPASLCGVVGMKPTYGRVSRYGVIAFASSLDQVGPLAKDVEGCAAVMEAIAGHDPRDATSLPHEPGAYLQACNSGIKGKRIGIPKEYFVDGLQSDVREAVDSAIDTLKSLGAEPIEISLPHTRYAVATYYLICTAEASSNLARYEGVRYGKRDLEATDLTQMYRQTRQLGFGPEVKRRIMLGTFALSAGYYDAYYAKAQRVRTLIRRDFDDAFKQCDLIVTPTSPTPAFPLGEKTADPLQMYLADIFTISCNLAGLPGISLGCGFTADELPIGLQILAKPLAEEDLFAAAAAYQHATDWHLRCPEMAR
jgi:aspartyl-tRNA(Asn)/glutamyl-tRNA(Gln) amidotransferase subunit A